MRLNDVAPELAEEISKLGDVELGAISSAVVAWVLGQVEIEDLRLVAALSALKERRVSDRIRDQLWELVQELDELAGVFRIQKRGMKRSWGTSTRSLERVQRTLSGMPS